MRGRPVAQCRLLLVVLALLATATVAVASSCGGDPYSGTWTATTAQGDHITRHIEKHGDGWTVTYGRDGSVNAVEEDGILIVVGPKNIGVTYERVDDLLRERVDGSTFADYAKQ